MNLVPVVCVLFASVCGVLAQEHAHYYQPAYSYYDDVSAAHALQYQPHPPPQYRPDLEQGRASDVPSILNPSTYYPYIQNLNPFPILNQRTSLLDAIDALTRRQKVLYQLLECSSEKNEISDDSAASKPEEGAEGAAKSGRARCNVIRKEAASLFEDRPLEKPHQGQPGIGQNLYHGLVGFFTNDRTKAKDQIEVVGTEKTAAEVENLNEEPAAEKNKETEDVKQ